MLHLSDKWVWDHWLVDTGSEYHIFYLQAPRSLGDPHLRHASATVGHAVSSDLVDWTVLADALRQGEEGRWDDSAIWTGSVVRHEGCWVLAYTGTSRAEHGLVQRIGLATSTDLLTWERVGDAAAIEADPRWYAVGDAAAGQETAWRDPWLFRDPEGDGWHALITADASHAPIDGRGVVGHAWSRDLMTWEVRPPLSEPGEFGHLEVTQIVAIEGRPVLIFCANPDRVSEARRTRVGEFPAGTYACSLDKPQGPFHVVDSRYVSELYAGRLVQLRDRSWALMGFVGDGVHGNFQGTISDPVPLTQLEHFPGMVLDLTA